MSDEDAVHEQAGSIEQLAAIGDAGRRPHHEAAVGDQEYVHEVFARRHRIVDDLRVHHVQRLLYAGTDPHHRAASIDDVLHRQPVAVDVGIAKRGVGIGQAGEEPLRPAEVAGEGANEPVPVRIDAEAAKPGTSPFHLFRGEREDGMTRRMRVVLVQVRPE